MPLVPADFKVTSLYRDLFDYNASLEWDPAPRNGVESVVFNYSLLIVSSEQANKSYIITLPFILVNFQYAIEYSVSITAHNCAGLSVFSSTLQYSKSFI